MICADSKHDHLWQRVEDLNPDLVCHPSAGYDWWFHEGEEPDPDKLKSEHAKMFGSIQSAQERAIDLDCAYVVSNPIGATGTVWWPGNSGIIDRDGAVVAWLPGEVVIERMRPGYVVGHITVGD
jgi:predicted amidohydrolase